MNEWIVVGIVAIAVIFGASKLPEIARNLGRSSSEFKKGMKEGQDEAARSDAPAAEPAPRPSSPSQPSTPPPDASPPA